MVTPTDRQGEFSATCLFEGWKIEGRDLQLLDVTFNTIIKPRIKLEFSFKCPLFVASIAQVISNLKVKADPIILPRPISE